uniref:Alpha-L-fucosidase n=1 Tax=Panagrolaimus sp. PS1159 TaxID=55785 RepID=A0AC35GL53_9BILA
MLGFILFLTFALNVLAHNYEPTWESIDSRPIPNWYDDSKFGIFCHWGVYSVPAHRSEWIWWYWKSQKDKEVSEYLDKHFHGQTYADFARDFTAEDFNPKEFASIIKASGARYFVFTSKHHEGFTMWPSNTSFSWNAFEVGPKRDIVDFSQMDWFHPLYINDNANNRSDFSEQVSYPQMLEIVNTYKPEIIWSDGDWDKSDDYWKSKDFIAWLYNKSPVKDNVVINDRWGHEIMGKHGGFLTYSDHYDPGHLLERKWENCMTLDRGSWGYRRDMKADDVHTVQDLISQLARTISCNGNFLLNVGPSKYGRIDPIFEDRLTELGKFVKIHEEAIFDTKPWIHQNDSFFIWYTSKVRSSDGLVSSRVFNPQQTDNTIIYAWILQYPKDNKVALPSVHLTKKTRITLLGTNIKLRKERATKGIIVDLSDVHWTQFPSKDAVVLKIEYAAKSNHNPLKSSPRHRRRHHHPEEDSEN